MLFKISNILLEDSFSGRKTKPLVDAIKNRNPVTFFYSGPKKPEKIRVKPGVRVRAEIVALGLSSKGNLIVRAYVQPPSVTKKGYDKTNWRTFIVSRMSNINVIEDVTFDAKRPGYKDGAESTRGPMVTTYVTTDWTKTPDVKTKEVPQPTPEPVKQPEVKTLPQPKVDTKPPAVPIVQKNHVEDVFKTINPNEIDNKKIITTQDYRTAVSDLFKRKENDWKETQKELGKNERPGDGTRKRFDIESNKELSSLLNKNNIIVLDKLPEPSEENNALQESLSRIKSLMLIIK